MRTLGNILWFILGGWWTGTIYMILALLFCITIIGIPIGKAMFQYGKLMYFPFGKEIVRETFIKGKENVSPIRKIGGIIANIIWFPFGLLMLLSNIAMMIALCLTIIFIPVAVVLARSSLFLLTPIGAKVVSRDDVLAIKLKNAVNSNT